MALPSCRLSRSRSRSPRSRQQSHVPTFGAISRRQLANALDIEQIRRAIVKCQPRDAQWASATSHTKQSLVDKASILTLIEAKLDMVEGQENEEDDDGADATGCWWLVPIGEGIKK